MRQRVCVFAERGTAPGSDVAVARGWGVESICWCSYLVLWQAGPLNQPELAGLRRALHARPCISGGGGVSQAKSDQRMRFRCATGIRDEDDITWKVMETARGETAKDIKRGRRRQKQELKVEPPLILAFLKAKPLSPGEQWDNTLPYFNKKRVLCNTLCTRSKSRAFICRRQSHINYQKNRIKK